MLQKIDFEIETLLQFLEQKRRKIAEEIRAYPPPIPACDAQFNYLLAERSKLSREIRELQEMKEDISLDKNNSKQFRAFIEKSVYVDSNILDKLLDVSK